MTVRKLKGLAPFLIPFIACYCFFIAVCVWQLVVTKKYFTWIVCLSLGILAVAFLIYVIIDSYSELTVSEDGVTYQPKIGKRRHIGWEDCGLIGLYVDVRTLQIFFSTERYVCYSLHDCLLYARKNRKKIISILCYRELLDAVEQYAPYCLSSACKGLYREFVETSQYEKRIEARKKKRAIRKEACERKQVDRERQEHWGL